MCVWHGSRCIFFFFEIYRCCNEQDFLRAGVSLVALFVEHKWTASGSWTTQFFVIMYFHFWIVSYQIFETYTFMNFSVGSMLWCHFLVHCQSHVVDIRYIPLTLTTRCLYHMDSILFFHFRDKIKGVVKFKWFKLGCHSIVCGISNVLL